MAQTETPADDSGEAQETKAAVKDQKTEKSEKSEKREKKERKPKKDRQTGQKLKAGANAIRDRIATIVWLVAVVCALFLAVGALLVALKANQANGVVDFVKSAAHHLDLGVFSPENGIFTPKKDPNLVKASLINWGLGAVFYLVVGKVLDRIIRP